MEYIPLSNHNPFCAKGIGNVAALLKLQDFFNFTVNNEEDFDLHLH